MTQPDPDLIKAREWFARRYLGGEIPTSDLYDNSVELQCFLAGLKAGRAEREG